jgi:hypothetical protein
MLHRLYVQHLYVLRPVFEQLPNFVQPYVQHHGVLHPAYVQQLN